jgi:hypothetical protein
MQKINDARLTMLKAVLLTALIAGFSLELFINYTVFDPTNCTISNK